MAKNDRRSQCTPQDNFQNGITNGAQWYDVPGGMQDFNYVHSNAFEITIELTCCKYPEASKLVSEWRNNKESLLKYMELVHSGVKGVVIDSSTKKPIRNARVKLWGSIIVIKYLGEDIFACNKGYIYNFGLLLISGICSGYKLSSVNNEAR